MESHQFFAKAIFILLMSMADSLIKHTQLLILLLFYFYVGLNAFGQEFYFITLIHIAMVI